jgi:FkbM family methyltransferase
MIRILRTIAADFFGLVRVCGMVVAFRWLTRIVATAGACRDKRNLQPADLAMGEGPFDVRFGAARAKLTGPHILSGIREVWVRNMYLDRGRVSIPPDATVVDLGASHGDFTVLALAHGPGVRVVAVEASADYCARLARNVALNHWESRVQICNRFIGGRTTVQDDISRYAACPTEAFLSEEEFVHQYNIRKIDLLKCDIEGSEYALLHPGSLLLAMARQLAIEVHTAVGDREAFIAMLKQQGFDVVIHQSDPGGSTLTGVRRSSSPAVPSTPQAA